jgi:PIN domain nuclease of toxin-antitoxin system
MALYLDTHALIWYLSESKQLSEKANRVIDKAFQNSETVYISAITVVEIIYLVEKGRIPKQALELLLPALEDSSVLTIDNIDLDTVLAVQKIPRKDVPDMPDRLIGPMTR